MPAAVAAAEAACRVIVPARIDPAAFVRRDGQARVHRLGGATMGTRWSVQVAARILPAGLEAALADALDAIVGQMSNWEPASDLSRFNRAPAGRWMSLPPDLFHVVAEGVRHAEASGGAFDPTAGALVDLWGFGPQGMHPGLPGAGAIADARARSGWRRLDLDQAARRARQPGGLALDLSGIAKGHAVDRLGELLRAHGCADFLAEIGGELLGRGLRPDGQPWWVAIEPPGDGALPITRIALHDLAVATSGDYRRFVEHDGRRFAHSIDPRIGAPIANGVASVTVLHERCIDADALATALTVLGADDGMAHAAQRDIAALFVVRSGTTFREAMSPAMAAMSA